MELYLVPAGRTVNRENEFAKEKAPEERPVKFFFWKLTIVASVIVHQSIFSFISVSAFVNLKNIFKRIKKIFVHFALKFNPKQPQIMNKEIENKLIHKNTKPTSMRILVYDFLSSQPFATSLSEIENHFQNANRTTIYRTLKTLKKKELFTAFRKTRPQNINCATTIATKKPIRTGIYISTVKSANKRLAKKIYYSPKV